MICSYRFLIVMAIPLNGLIKILNENTSSRMLLFSSTYTCGAKCCERSFVKREQKRAGQLAVCFIAGLFKHAGERLSFKRNEAIIVLARYSRVFK